MRIVSFNVNGLRAVLKKDKQGKKLEGAGDIHVLNSIINEYDPDILCLQETKCPADYDAKLHFAFSKVIASKTRKGYSGVAVYSKTVPLSVKEDFELNDEGRVIALEYPKFWLLNTYTPNSKPDLSRLDYRVDVWEPAISKYIKELQKRKPVIYTSDFNVAPSELDIHNPKGNEKSHGFTIQERTAFATLLKECRLVDSYRYIFPDKQEYTWFSPFAKSRERNKGWRIDNILVGHKLQKKILSVQILSDVHGSDHVPVLLDIGAGANIAR